jgi:hypothetical protein
MSQVVKVLVVTDSSGGFLNQDFQLGEFLGVLQATSWEGFTLQITKAHRENMSAAGIGADLVNFDFATHDLSQYDEILLFPIRRDNDVLQVPTGAAARSSNVTDAEVAAIARFMDAGGGVFSTGDHEDLGAGLCKRLPRIRNMRRWYWDTAGPNGEPIAPRGTPGVLPQATAHTDAELVDRHDTLVAGHDFDPAHPNNNYQFDDQSDNIAQRISPRIFETRSSRYIRQTWPHPLLCSPEGMVRYLPDHAHEGQCEVPSNLSLRVTVPGYDEEEYPALAGGSRLEPVVVADATVTGGHATFNPFKPPVNGKTFGVIGAYDGHRISRAGNRLGRVVVDATWHHFFNINLTGDQSSGEAAKRQGFYAALNPGQPDHYKMIKHYYRNIVYWLIPFRRWEWIFHSALSKMVRSGQFYELNPVVRVRDFERIDLSQILALSHLADAYFRKAHGACWSLQLLPILLYEFDPLKRIWEQFEPHVDPWSKLRDKAQPEPIGLEPELFADTLLGSAVVAMLKANAEIGGDATAPLDAEQEEKSVAAFQKHLPQSLLFGAQRFGKQLELHSKQLAKWTGEFGALGQLR